MSRFKNWKPPAFDKDGWAYRERIFNSYLGKYGWRVQYQDNLKLGKNVDIGCFSFLQAKEGIVIEDEVQIGGGVMIYSIDTIDNIKGKVTLRKNCKIGANSIILPRCIIGKNSVVGALSKINFGTTIHDDEIWAGNPAHKIGYIKNNKRIYEKEKVD